MRYRRVRMPVVAFTLVTLGADLASAQGAADKGAAVRALIESSRVTLNLENASPDDAYRKLSEASGNKIAPPKRQPARHKPVTLQIKNEPFWKAVDMLNQVAPANLNVDSSRPELKIRWVGKPYVPLHKTYAGPAKVRLYKFQVLREAIRRYHYGYGEKPRTKGPYCRLAFTVKVEPRIPLTAARISLTKLIDDTGKDLLAPAADKPGARLGYARASAQSRSRAISRALDVLVRYPASSAKTLATMEAKLGLSIIPSMPPVRVGLAAPGEQVKYGRYTLTLKDPEAERPGRVRFGIDPRPTSDRESRRNWARTQWVDAQGNATPVRFVGTGGHRGPGGGPRQYQVKFDCGKEAKPVALLLPAIVEPVWHDYAFSFANVELPGLTAAHAPGKPAPDAVVPPAKPIAPVEGILPLKQMPAGRFSLTAEDMPLWDVLNDIRQQTENPFKADGENPKYLARRRKQPLRVTAELKDVTYWEGLDTIAENLGLNMYLDGSERDPYLQIRRSRRGQAGVPPPRFSQRIGPLKVRLTSVGIESRSEAEYGSRLVAKDAVRLTIGFQIWIEPGMRVLKHAVCIQECWGNHGQDLATLQEKRSAEYDTEFEDPRFTWRLRSTVNPRVYVSLHVPLAEDQIPASVSRLLVYYGAHLFAKTAKVEVAVREKHSYALENGLTLNWDPPLGRPARAQRPRRDMLTFNVLRDGGELSKLDIASMRKFRITDREGERLRLPTRFRIGSGTTSTGGRSGKAPDRILFHYPTGLKTYGGFIEFRDIPVPALPRLPAKPGNGTGP